MAMSKRTRSKPHRGKIDIEEIFDAPVTAKEKAIIEAAVALIGQRGIDGATTAEIARHAGVTERTLFRYFPSKRDLVRRVLFPLLVKGGIAQQWEALGNLLRTKSPDLKAWYVAAALARFKQVSIDPVRPRMVMIELLQNAELRDAMATMWQKNIWQPMLQNLTEMQAAKEMRSDIDIEVLARMMHYLQSGYYLTRFVFAPNHKWNDAREFDQMGEVLARGASRRKSG